MTEQQMLRSDIPDSSHPADDLWRSEVQAKIARYRTRRGRRTEGAYSMRFPFGADEATPKPPANVDALAMENAIEEAGATSLATEFDELPDVELHAQTESPEVAGPLASEASEESRPAVACLTEAEAADSVTKFDPEPEADFLPPEPAYQLEPEPLLPPVSRPPAKRKVLAFPRQPSNQEETYRLADPVLPEQPRILDVPEELEPFPTTPLLEGLRLPANQQAAAPSPDHIELEAKPVSIARRIGAGAIDAAVVAAACLVFGAVAYKFLAPLELTKPLLLASASLPVLLWSAYQYIMMMYAGRTAGMQLTGIQVRTFQDQAPGWRHRRSRTFGLYFSTASLMMGLLWSLVDVDALCWHDRISHTYLIRRE